MKKYRNKLICRTAALILAFSIIAPVGVSAAGGVQSNTDITIDFRLKDLLFNKRKAKSESDTVYLCPGGDAFGVKICGSGVRVLNTSDSTEREGLLPDDKIISVEGREVFSVSDVKEMVAACSGEKVNLEIRRGGKKIKLSLTPTKVGSEYQLGVILSDGTAGIGTLTYINPKTGEFGGLGHGICDSHSGEVLPMTEGEITTVVLGGAIKGECGKPGELRGVLMDKCQGRLFLNTECGVFGKLTAFSAEKLCSKKTLLPVGRSSEVHEGEATILSTVKNGNTGEYKIMIESIDRAASGSKSFRIKVTDEALIALTGGIVRGMGV